MNASEKAKMRKKVETDCSKRTRSEIADFFNMREEELRMKHIRKYQKICKKTQYTEAMWNVFNTEYGRGYDYDFDEFKRGHLVRLVRVGDTVEKIFIKDLNASQPLFWKLVEKAARFTGLKSFVIPDNPELEQVLNIMMYGISYMRSWSEYLLGMASGRKMLYDLFENNPIKAMINLYSIIYAVQISGAYDDLLFRKDLIEVLPYILPGEMLVSIGLVSPEAIRSSFALKIQAGMVTSVIPLLTDFLERKLTELGVLERVKMIVNRGNVQR